MKEFVKRNKWTLAAIVAGAYCFDRGANGLYGGGLGEYCYEMLTALKDCPLDMIDVVIDNAKDSLRDIGHNKYANLSALGQTLMYGGIGNGLHKVFKKKK